MQCHRNRLHPQRREQFSAKRGFELLIFQLHDEFTPLCTIAWAHIADAVCIQRYFNCSGGECSGVEATIDADGLTSSIADVGMVCFAHHPLEQHIAIDQRSTTMVASSWLDDGDDNEPRHICITRKIRFILPLIETRIGNLQTCKQTSPHHTGRKTVSVLRGYVYCWILPLSQFANDLPNWSARQRSDIS